MSAPSLSPARSTKPINSQRPLSRPLNHLEARQQTNITRRATDAFIGNTARPAWGREFRPLACELLPRFLFIIHAILQRLIDSQAGGGGGIELATPRDIKLRHSV